MRTLLKSTLFVIATGLLTGACADNEHEPLDASNETSVHLTHLDDSKHVTLDIDTPLSVQLESVPTAGYTWMVLEKPDWLTLEEDIDITATDPENQSKPGFTGGNHYITLHFSADQPSEGKLVLIEGRQWEVFDEQGDVKDEGAIEDRFSIRITAQ